jgi:hypothetical protein
VKLLVVLAADQTSRVTRSSARTLAAKLTTKCRQTSKTDTSSQFTRTVHVRHHIKVECDSEVTSGSPDKCSSQKRQANDIQTQSNQPETQTVLPDGRVNLIANAKKIKWEPACWRELLRNIEVMRQQRDAPVDTMGCDKICDDSALPEVSQLSVLLPDISRKSVPVQNK